MLLIKLLFDVSAPRGQVVKGVSSVFWMLYLNLCCVMTSVFVLFPVHILPIFFLPGREETFTPPLWPWGSPNADSGLNVFCWTEHNVCQLMSEFIPRVRSVRNPLLCVHRHYNILCNGEDMSLFKYADDMALVAHMRNSNVLTHD